MWTNIWRVVRRTRVNFHLNELINNFHPNQVQIRRFLQCSAEFSTRVLTLPFRGATAMWSRSMAALGAGTVLARDSCQRPVETTYLYMNVRPRQDRHLIKMTFLLGSWTQALFGRADPKFWIGESCHLKVLNKV